MPASQPIESTSTKPSSTTTSTRMSGYAFRNGATMSGKTMRAALDGTLSLSVPVGLSRNTFRTSSAASISLNRGVSFSMRRRPASVGATLRVVRFRRRRPSLASRRRTAMLRLEADTPLLRAASRKPPARATETKAARSFSSMAIVHIFKQPVHVKPVYLTTQPRHTAAQSFIKESAMSNSTFTSTFSLAGRPVWRMGYGAMQLAGPGVFGPPKDRDAALAVLREGVAAGVDHIDTSDFYGPHITNQLIREALHPYPDGLVIVTKVGAVRGADAAWIHAA